MGLYGFKKQFVPHILDGTKQHTIRAERKHMDKPGDIMHLYTGLRQKGARLLMRVPCMLVEPISIETKLIKPREGVEYSPVLIFVGDDRIPLSPTEAVQLAIKDGFPHWQAFTDFWRDRLPFRGHIYHWDFKRRVMR